MTCKARGSGWVCDQMQLVDVCVADDVVLFSDSRDGVLRMLVETRDAFRSRGPDVGMETRWTCWPQELGEAVCNDDLSVVWDPHPVFVGGVLGFHGNSGSAIDHRIVQSEKTYHR